jgi:hypothetical protein
MLLAAARPELTGPLVINGAPMSYWSGSWSGGEGENPMRYLGGLLGGSWVALLTSDLGNGLVDGAHFIANFERLNPANTLWTKYYNLFAKVDTEAPRFLGFERWWGGYILMNEEEIRWIVDNLFVGNRLAHGEAKAAGQAGSGPPAAAKDPRELPLVKEALAAIGKGGYAEGVALTAALLGTVAGPIPLARLELINRLIRSDKVLSQLPADARARIKAEQAVVAELEPEAGLRSLPRLLPGAEERRQVMDLVDEVVTKAEWNQEQKDMLARIRAVLDNGAGRAGPQASRPLPLASPTTCG